MRRWGLPKWQFALTSSQAVSDVIRLARAATRRQRVVVFEGKYQGHVAELLAIADGEASAPEYDGITASDIARTVVVPWNDLEAVFVPLAREHCTLTGEAGSRKTGTLAGGAGNVRGTAGPQRIVRRSQSGGGRCEPNPCRAAAAGPAALKCAAKTPR